MLKRFADLQRDPGDDVAHQVLHRQADDDRRNPRRDEQALDRLAIAKVQHQKERDDQDGKPRNFAQELGNLDAMLLLKIQLPDVAIHQRDEKDGAQKKGAGAHLATMQEIHLEQACGHINRKSQGKEVIEIPEPDSVTSLQTPPQQHHEAIKPRHDQYQQQVTVRRGQGVGRRTHITRAGRRLSHGRSVPAPIALGRQVGLRLPAGSEAGQTCSGSQLSLYFATTISAARMAWK